MTYLINLVLAVLCTPLLSGVNLASLHTLLHQASGSSYKTLIIEFDECSFVRGLFIGVTESMGGANTLLKQRDFASV